MTAGEPPATVAGVPPVRFAELTPEQAGLHLEAYTAGMPGRLARLPEVVEARGGPATALDGSPGSLDVLWDWYRHAPHATEPPWSGDDEGLPIWLPHDVPYHRDFSAELLDDLDLLSAYAADVVRRADPTATWAVGSGPKRARYVWQHQPVLRRTAGRELNPRHQVGTSISRTFVHRRPTGYESLRLA